MRIAKIVFGLVALLLVIACTKEEERGTPIIDCVSVVNLWFDEGSTALSARSQKILSGMVGATGPCAIYGNPDPRKKMAYMVNGYSDKSGPEWLNEQLSLRRAQTVAEYMIDLGVPREQICARGFGSKKLLTPTEGPEPQNRRVEFWEAEGAQAENLLKRCLKDKPTY